MPPKSRRPGRKGRKKEDDNPGIPAVYEEMLAEAGESLPSQFDSQGRSAKRRRVGGQSTPPRSDIPEEVGRLDDRKRSASKAKAERDSEGPQSSSLQKPTPENPKRQAPPFQPSEEEDEDEDSSDSEICWEDVNVGTGGNSGDENDESTTLELNLEGAGRKAKSSSEKRAKALSKAERDRRVLIHQMHFLCLVSSLALRNRWCSDKKVKKRLKPLSTAKMADYLNPNPDFSQFQQTRSFMDGLTQASELWRPKFTISAMGSRAATWSSDSREANERLSSQMLDEPLLDVDDFARLASERCGSRDIAAQLFCALLRSVGVTTRLVCSLQILPLTNSSKKSSSTDERVVRIFKSNPEANTPGAASTGSPLNTKMSNGSKGKPRIRQSKYPVFWVEAFNQASQKWIPVDPIVNGYVGKAGRFEPPIADSENSMSYVIAFDDEGFAKDVTRRYAKAFNAKTRRQRIESTKDGARWLKRAMKRYKRPWKLDRDLIEDAELQALESQEPMPRNIQDFKNHPFYALERHLRQSEALHPKIKIGQVNSGKHTEPVYRRESVHRVRSADQWYILGRDVVVGEQPLKYAAPRRKFSLSPEPDDLEANSDGVGLYAEFQTSLYIPPPVVNGLIPKNSFGNIDVYVPTMIPPGGIHVLHPEAKDAARSLAIDHAAAVTGFEFRGRHAMAVNKGVIVAKEYREAMVETITSIHQDKLQERNAQKSFEALARWKRFLVALRIRERVNNYDIEGEDDADVESSVSEENRGQDEHAATATGGGFFPDLSASGDPLSNGPGGSPYFDEVQPAFLTSQDYTLEIEIIEPPTPTEPAATEHNRNGARLSPEGLAYADINEKASLTDHKSPKQPANDIPTVDTSIEVESRQPISEDVEMAESSSFVLDDLNLNSPAAKQAALTSENDVSADGEGDSKEVAQRLKNGSGENAQMPASEVEDKVIARSPSSDSLSKGSLMSEDPDAEDAEVDWI